MAVLSKTNYRLGVFQERGDVWVILRWCGSLRCMDSYVLDYMDQPHIHFRICQRRSAKKSISEEELQAHHSCSGLWLVHHFSNVGANNMLSWVCRGQQTFSVKGQMVNIFGFVDHRISAATIQLCCWIVKTAIDYT